MPGQNDPELPHPPEVHPYHDARERTKKSWAWFKNLEGVRCVRRISAVLMKRVNRSMVLGFLLWDMLVTASMTTFYFMHDNIANLGLVSEHAVRVVAIFRLLIVIAGIVVVLQRHHHLVRHFFTLFVLNWIVLGVVFLIPIARMQCSCADGTWEQCHAMQDFWEKGLHLNFKPPPEQWRTKLEGHFNKDMLVEPLPDIDEEKTAAFNELLARLPEDGQSFLERSSTQADGTEPTGLTRRLPKRLLGPARDQGHSVSFWITRQQRPMALVQRHAGTTASVDHGSAWHFRVHEMDPDEQNSTASAAASQTTTPLPSSAPVKCEEQIFTGKQGQSLMEEAVLQQSSSSFINSTQFAQMLLRKSLTNELTEKLHVSMQRVVQNLLEQPEFKAIICEYAKHIDSELEKTGKNRSRRKAWKHMRKQLAGTLMMNGALAANAATGAASREAPAVAAAAAARTGQRGTYRLLQSELEGLPSSQGMTLLKAFYEDMCRCADLDSCRLSESDTFWCYVDESTLQGCKAEQVKLLKDSNNKTWSKDLCSKRPCEPANLGMKPRPSSKKELDRQRHPELKDDNMLMRYGSDCDIWKHSDPLEWAFVGFDTTCIERTRRAIPKNGDWPKGLPYMFLSWTACTSNLLFDTKRNDGAVGALYQVKIRCTWYQMVLETFLILDLICTVPMMVIMYYFIANRCADNLEVEQQFAPVDDSSDSSEEFRAEVPQSSGRPSQAPQPRPPQPREIEGGLEAASSP